MYLSIYLWTSPRQQPAGGGGPEPGHEVFEIPIDPPFVVEVGR